jgi:glycosyltransferase involved in cell wall biosynthesis
VQCGARRAVPAIIFDPALNASSPSRPAVASYCATFLKPEMQHIYRQISGLERVRPIVITQKRENPELFPFEPVHRIPKPATHFFRRFWFRQLLNRPWEISELELEALLRILNKTETQLLHIYFGHIAVHLRPLIRSWPGPTIVSFHGADALVELEKPAYRRATAEMLGMVRRILVRSESLREAIVSLGADRQKIEILRTGIPVEQFPFRPRSVPDDGNWRLSQAGRLIEKKGFATSLRAFAVFQREYPNATLDIAGEGQLLYELQALARILKIESRVSFRGLLNPEALRQLFYESHIFLHPSHMGRDGNQEGVPNSMLEAMATGLPVFATNHGGIPEAVHNGLTGVLVPEKDHTALAGALIESVRDPAGLFELGRAGSESVAQGFDRTAQVRRLEDFYLETIERGG